jgi:hypothetical protein
LPDGRKLVFQAPTEAAADVPRGYPGSEGLFLMDRVTRKVRELLAVPEMRLDYPAPSPDRRWLLYVRTRVEADIWTLTPDRRD